MPKRNYSRWEEIHTIVHCPNCAKYEISGTAEVVLSKEHQNTRLAFAIRERTLNRKEEVRIYTDNIEKLVEGINYPTTIKEKAELVLKTAYTESIDEKLSSKGFTLDEINRVIFNIETNNKLGLVINYLKDRDWFEMTKLHKEGAFLDDIKGKGIDHAEEILSPNLNSTQVFVAMSFNNELDIFYEKGIKHAVQECGLIPLRIDHTEFNEEIIQKVFYEITKSRFIIADFTGNRSGVYLEAGYAIGKNIPVIYCCRKSDEGDLHFDVRHFNFIMWDDVQELKDKLVKRISETGLRMITN